jgi:hypothetical protein
LAGGNEGSMMLIDTVLSAVLVVVGIALGEVFDVWYDMTHSEATVTEVGREQYFTETIMALPDRPLAFGYAKQYFREVLATPDAFEHYHWGLWLLTTAFTTYSFNPTAPFLLVGVAVSLILDENRQGLADHPFGIGKPYFTSIAIIGVLLVATLVLRILSISTEFEPWISLGAFVEPFVILALLWGMKITSR